MDNIRQGKILIPVWKILVLIMFIGACIYEGQYLLAAAVVYFAGEKLGSAVAFSIVKDMVRVIDLLNQRQDMLEAKLYRKEVKDE